MLTGLSVAAAASGLLHVRADYFGPRIQTFFFKPLTLLFLLAIVWTAPAEVAGPYRGLILAGLVFSLVGDSFLLLRSRYFVYGLLAFLVAHLLYIGAFYGRLTEPPRLLTLAPLTVWTGMLFWVLRPGLGTMRIPVLVYSAVISVMVWMAIECAHANLPGASLAMLGAILFGLSDTVLALARFGRNFRFAQPLILSLYYGGQWLIALSVYGAAPPPA